MEAVSRTACKSACAMSHRPFRPNIPYIRPLYQTHANGLRPTILPYRVRPISNTNPARDSPCRCNTELTNRVRSANRPISNTQRKKPYRMCFDHSSITAPWSNWPKSPALSAVPISPYQAIYKGKCSWKAIVSAQVIGIVRRAPFRTRCPASSRSHLIAAAAITPPTQMHGSAKTHGDKQTPDYCTLLIWARGKSHHGIIVPRSTTVLRARQRSFPDEGR